MQPIPAPSGVARATSPEEQRAREHLAGGRWRKARDGFKELCKKDRSKYLPLVVEANMGLAREMMDKGQVSEAGQVIAYLRTIAPRGLLEGLELQLARQAGNSAQMLPRALALLSQTSLSLPVEELRPWADEMVLAFVRPATQTPAESRVADEVEAVQRALEAVSAGAPARGLELTRALGSDSVFSHWRMFIKGLAAFHAGEAEKAARCFAGLPKDSVPGRAGEAWLLLLGPDRPAGRVCSEAVAEAAAGLTGHSEWGRLLVRAEAAWRGRQPVESYRVFRDGVGSFPSEGVGLAAVLADFYFNSLRALDNSGHGKYQEFFLEIEENGRPKNTSERARIRRTFSLQLAEKMPPELLQMKWEGFVADYQQLRGPSPRLASRAYGWLGDVFSRPARRRMFETAAPSKPRDGQRAVSVLRRSIELDPQNADAHLSLCAVCQTLGMTRDRNRLLDVMTKRFPDNKGVLLLAGEACVERMAFHKGLEYFERATELDRLDPAVPDLLSAALWRLARQSFEKGKAVEGRKTLARAGELLVAQPDHYARGAWCFFIRSGILELARGDAVQGGEWLERGRLASPSPTAFRLFARIAARFYSPKTGGLSGLETPLGNPWDGSRLSGAPALVGLYQFWRREPGLPSIQREEKWLRQYLESAARSPFSREEARRVVEIIEPNSPLRAEAAAIAARVLEKDPADPLFRMYQYGFQPFSLRDEDEDQARLTGILDEATRRGDEEAAKMARRALEDLAGAEPPEPGGGDGPSDFDEELDQAFDAANNFSGPGSESLEAGAALADLAAMFGSASEAQIRRWRKNRPPGMTVEIFETLVQLGKMGLVPPEFPPPRANPAPKAPQPRPPLPKASHPPPPQPEDPSQLKLF